MRSMWSMAGANMRRSIELGESRAKGFDTDARAWADVCCGRPHKFGIARKSRSSASGRCVL